MTEERETVMTLISREKVEPMSLRLSFSIISQPIVKNASKHDGIFNIYNAALIKLIWSLKSDGEHTHYIQAKKAELAKELRIQIHVVCKEPEYDSIMLCTEKWIKRQTMGSSNDTFFNVQIDVIMDKADLIVWKLHKDKEFTDFKLSTAEGSVAVHRAQMAVSSEVLKSMLSGEWKETTEGRIEMEGVTLQTLQDLKVYMYLGALPLPHDRLCPLLLIARCYLMDTLKADCITKLTQMVSSKDLNDVLEFSFFNKFPELTFAVLGAISKDMVDDAQKIMLENQKNCKKDEADDDGGDDDDGNDGGDGDTDDGDNDDDE